MTTLNLPPAHVLNVQTDVGSTAVVLRLADMPGGGDPLSSTPMGANVSATFGPYAVSTRFDLQVLTGRLAYNMALSVNEPVAEPTPAPVPAPPPPPPPAPTPPTPPAPAPGHGGGEHGQGDSELAKAKDTLPGPPSWSRAP